MTLVRLKMKMTRQRRRELVVFSIQLTLGDHSMSREFALEILSRLPCLESDLGRDAEVLAFVETVRAHFKRLFHGIEGETLA